MVTEIGQLLSRDHLLQLFAKAKESQIKNKGDYRIQEDWEKNGVKTFKRKVLGLCGRTCIKSLDGIAQTLYETGIASSLNEGKEIAPSLSGHSFYYGGSHFLKFDKVVNSKDEEAYRIEVDKSYD